MRNKERLSTAIQKLAEEDPTFTVRQDEEIDQTIIGGMGELHLDTLVGRMKREFKVNANVGVPMVTYRETVRKKVDKTKYTHKKQTDDSSQSTRVLVTFELLVNAEDGAIYKFVNAVTGGYIPYEYIPSVDADIQGAMQFGVLADYPMMGAKATLEDSAYHEVDLSGMAFKVTGNMMLKESARHADPMLLESVMDAEIRTSEEYTGDATGGPNTRRGMIESIEDVTGAEIIRALAPLNEMFGYAGDLHSKTQGRAVYTMQMDSYAEVLKNVADEIIKKIRSE